MVGRDRVEGAGQLERGRGCQVPTPSQGHYNLVQKPQTRGQPGAREDTWAYLAHLGIPGRTWVLCGASGGQGGIRLDRETTWGGTVPRAAGALPPLGEP